MIAKLPERDMTSLSTAAKGILTVAIFFRNILVAFLDIKIVQDADAKQRLTDNEHHYRLVQRRETTTNMLPLQ